MSKNLVIVESPAKAKTIGKFLGKNYSIKASMGHVRDLPKSKLGVDIENDFALDYITIRGKGDILKELRDAAQKAERVFLAADPDREGEAIAWHLLKSLKLDEKSKCRIEFNEITKETIKEAVKHPRSINLDRVDSQQARRVLDRLVGYKLSPLLWKKVKKGLSAGRVQSVALKLICDREEEIRAFIPEEYWSLTAFLKNKDNVKLEAKLVRKNGKKLEIKTEEEMATVLDEIKQNHFEIEDIKATIRKRNPEPPFTTSSLQQEANRRLNFPAKKTMRIAQQLYEGISLGKEGNVGLVTYIRTDSKRISETALSEAREYILNIYGKDYLPGKANFYKNKGKSQDAHEAIRPTEVMRSPEKIKDYLSREQYRLYRLIWEKFISSQMTSAQIEQLKAKIKAGKYGFDATASRVLFDGFMILAEKDQQEKEERVAGMKGLHEGEKLNLGKLEPKQHFTQPPPRYTEASLVKTLEEKGIGRPSTYAPIVDTIMSRGYVAKEDKAFFPTELGFVIIDLLKEYFQGIIDVDFTAKLEASLDEIEEGQKEWKNVLKEFYSGFSEDLKHAEEVIGKIEVRDEESEEVCEKCGRNMVIKMGRFGKFLACPGFPDCRNTKPLLQEIGVSCPQCSEGQVVLRRSKKGRSFYGCSLFPECDFVSWDKPLAQKCPKCNSYMTLKSAKGSNKSVCSNKECGYTIAFKEKE